MKSRWIIGLLLTCALAVSAKMLKRIAANKARKAQSQISRGRTRAAQQALPRNYRHPQECRMPEATRPSWRRFWERCRQS